MLERVLRAWFDIAAILLALCVLALPSRWLTDFFFNSQDLPVLVGLLVAAGLCRLGLRLFRGKGANPKSFAASPLASALRVPVWAPYAAVGLALLCGAFAYFGGHWIYHGYALSLDEYMARFDATILGRGAPLASVPAEWRMFEGALQPQFVRPIADGAFWSSTYLPVNAAMLAAATALGDASLLNPLFAVISVVAVYGASLRLWPRQPRIALTAAILLATSSQFLITAMTPYAMTAHLAFNLVWLWLFLRGGAAGHLGAVAVGFLACGLHQLAFHPLFAAPFILQLWLERRWAAASFQTLAYAAIGLFWVEYDPLVRQVFVPVGLGAATTVGTVGASSFLTQAQALLAAFDPARVGLMAKNLVRFVTWQNPLTPALVFAGAWVALRARGAQRSLLLGVLLTTLVMFIVLPYQGHGWGYRYLHGLLGSTCLLAAAAFDRLTRAVGPAERAAARIGFVLAAAVSVLVLLPVRAVQVHRFVTPYAVADQAVRHAGRDLVLVDDRGSLFTVDLVRNDPFLRNRPVVLSMGALGPKQMAILCAKRSIAVFDQSDARRFGIQTFLPPAVQSADLGRRAFLARARCGPNSLPIRNLGGAFSG